MRAGGTNAQGQPAPAVSLEVKALETRLNKFKLLLEETPDDPNLTALVTKTEGELEQTKPAHFVQLSQLQVDAENLEKEVKELMERIKKTSDQIDAVKKQTINAVTAIARKLPTSKHS